MVMVMVLNSAYTGPLAPCFARARPWASMFGGVNLLLLSSSCRLLGYVILFYFRSHILFTLINVRNKL